MGIIETKEFGVVKYTDWSGDGENVTDIKCPVCEGRIDSMWYLKDCPDKVLVNFECDVCHKVWIEPEVIRHEGFDFSTYC